MELKDVNKIQGANKLVRQWNTLMNMDTTSRLVFQVSGPGGGSNLAVMDSDPEFAEIWALVKAVVARKYEEQVTILEDARVNSPDVLPQVRAAVLAKRA